MISFFTFIYQFNQLISKLALWMSKTQEYIRIYARVKPCSSQQPTAISCNENYVFTNKTDSYEFSRVFDDRCSNQEIFKVTTEPIIQQCFQGFNSCILAYGQTSSGKTYTMKGQGGILGLIPHTVKQIFKRIQERKMKAQVRVSYFQIYNENIIDLLHVGNAQYLQVRDDGKKNTSIIGLIQKIVTSQDDALMFFERGEDQRKYAPTNVNYQSSRSHAIFRVSLNILHQNYRTSLSQINLVDLAGSESVNKTKADGMLKKEGENINKSLLALTNVIRSMSDRSGYVNFRDSKLTRILQSSLCANSKSIIICMIKQTEDCIQQTINTLKFGIAASNVRVAIKKNVDPSLSQSRSLFGVGFGFDNKDMDILQEERMKNKELLQENETLKQTIKNRDEQLRLRNLQISEFKYNLLQYEKEVDNNKQFHKYYKTKHSELQKKRTQEESALQKQIKDARQESNRLRDEIKFWRDKSKVLEQNERVLIDRNQQYSRQIRSLMNLLKSKEQEVVQSKEKLNPQKKGQMMEIQKLESLKKNEERFAFSFPPRPTIPANVSLFTIGGIVNLSKKIVQMKREMFDYVKSNAELQEEINILNERLASAEDAKKQNEKERNSARLSNSSAGNSKAPHSHKQPENVRTLKYQLTKLRRLYENCKKRQHKYLMLLRKNSEYRIKEIEGFFEYINQKNQNENISLYKLYTLEDDEDETQPEVKQQS